MPLTPERLLRDLYADPDALAAAAPGLTAAERRAAAPAPAAPWTPADVPLLDEAAELLGEPTDQAAVAGRRRARLPSGRSELDYAGRVLDLVGELAPDAAG